MYFSNVYEILKKVYVDGEYVGDAMRILSSEDKSIVTRIVYGVLERDTELDYYISKLTQKAPKKAICIILKMGLYCLIYMDSLPDYVVCDKLVELTKSIGKRELSSFVNAVLKRFLKEKLPLPENNEEKLSVLSSTPLWIVKKLLRQYKQDSEKILFAEGEKDSHVRCNLLLYSSEEFKKELEKRKIEFSESESGFYVKGTSNIRDLFDSGKITFQSPCSMKIAYLASTGARKILDVCSAPGGKSMLSAILMQNKGEIFSFDLHASKLPLIRESAERLGLSIICAEEQDAEHSREEAHASFGFVLCDVPCSGLGVLWKKPDLRYRVMEGRDALPALQSRILSESAKYVRAGGTLVYSTCTLRPEENERVVEKFLSSHPEFSLVPFAVGDLSAENGMLTTYPHRHGMDGFFVAKMQRS